MNCDNSTGPINISTNKNVSNCEGKCNLNYKYNITSVIAKNKKYYLSLNFNNNSNSVVKYSTNDRGTKCSSSGGDYSLNEMRIYYPSIHTYKGARADAEIIIDHTNLIGGNDLIICIPISINSGTQQNASTQVTEIIEFMTKVGNKPGEGGNIQGLNFNLNDFIPKNKGFFTYSASLPYPPCTKCVEYIVYDVNTASISLTNGTLNKLKTITSASKIPVKPITDDLGLAYNKKGAMKGIQPSGDSIYIDCQPTGEDGEILINENKDGGPVKNINFYEKFNDFFKSNVVNILAGILLVILSSIIIRSIGKRIFLIGGNSNNTSSLKDSISGGKNFNLLNKL